jgi:hypothetical protein
MSKRYVIEILGKGLVGFVCDGRRQVWTSTKTRARDKTCCLCGGTVKKGTAAYRPLGNTHNRCERAHKNCVERKAPPPREEESSK